MPVCPSPRRVRALVRSSQRSRLEAAALGRAYELALPIVRQGLADRRSVPPRPSFDSFTVPQKLVGG